MEDIKGYDSSYCSAFNVNDYDNYNNNKDELHREEMIKQFKKSQIIIDNKNIKKELLDIIEPTIELKSDYLGMSSYYYNELHDTIYEIDNSNMKLSKVKNDTVIKHLRELNNITDKKITNI